MKELWSLYHKEIPEFLLEFADTAPMLRLKEVGMNCGCEYTHFPRYVGLGSYSRFDHSLGVALIVWHFTGSMEQALAGLFHDVTTPVFAHVVDFLNGGHLRQESTEEGIAECLEASPEVMGLLRKYGVRLEEISDYHRYPIADNEAPALSADRLEYTLGNLLNYGFATLEQIRIFYQALMIGEDETGQAELIFRRQEEAAAFTRMALKNSYTYVADEDRFAMQALADLLREALERGVLVRRELWETEPIVIEKLKEDPGCNKMWQQFCGYSRILRNRNRPESGYWVCIDAKRRWIDPKAWGMGRVSQWDVHTSREIREFLELDFSHWLSAE